jgi:hypothetical protein
MIKEIGNKIGKINPEEIYHQIFRLKHMIKKIDYSNMNEGKRQYKKINEEIIRLSKLREEYYYKKIEEFKKKQKDTK